MKKIMKKISALLASAALAVGSFAFAASAAPSPSAMGVVTSISAAVDKNGKAVELTMSEEVDQKIVDTISAPNALKTLLGSAYKTSMAVIDVKEITAPAGTVFPVTVNFSIDPSVGVTANTKAYIFVWNGTSWDKMSATTSLNNIKGVFNHFGPVAYVIDKATLSGASVPNTGDSSDSYMLGGIMAAAAVVAAGCVIVLVSKRKKNA